MLEADVDAGGSRTTARHRPTPELGGAPAGPEPCDLVTVPARQGLEAVDILRRGTSGAVRLAATAAPAAALGVGPVLHDGACDTLGFLVPPGTAAAWDLPGSACTQTYGRGTRAAAAEPPVAGTGWLVPPADAAEVTDPVVLRAALGEAARTIEAADRCR
ncbi:hypothetical protein [Streptomyces sp. URMC 123]|uniref:hypothetical protein n=1 Tax=Streptomyces sp. URMC 123 TaxID=3423403 RepID=UPI003F19676A